MDIFNSSGKRIRLTDKDFLSEGGEGRLFSQKGQVFKIYLDKSKIIPVTKMDELARLDHRSIVRPMESIFDKHHERIGFSMMEVPNAIPLARLFTSTFWNTHAVTPEKVSALIKKMQDTIRYIHDRGFLQVDGNEFNYMVSEDLARPFFIDVDSFQTPSFPATAIMPSIRDYNQEGFDQSTDWFSFAVIAFQMFVGIHPFKGRHPDFKKGDFEGRVKAGISVLNKSVSYPSSVRDLSMIPNNYREWFEMMFESGERLAPPTATARVTVQARSRIIKSCAKVSVTNIGEFPYSIRRFNSINGQQIVRAGNRLYVGKTPYDIPDEAKGIYMRDTGKPAFLVIHDGLLGIMNAETGELTPSSMGADQILVSVNVPYVVRDDDLFEVNIMELNSSLVLSPGPVRKILPNAFSAFDGIFYENVLGKAHLRIPVQPGEMPLIRTPELDGYKIVDARYLKQVAFFVIADKKGDYHQLRFRFSNDFNDYDTQIMDDVDDPLNFTVLDKGIIVSLPKEGRMEIVSSSMNSDAVRLVEDLQVGSFMRLYNDSGRVVGVYGRKTYAISLQSK